MNREDLEKIAVSIAKSVLEAEALPKMSLALAKKIIAEHKPRFPSKQAYLDFIDSLCDSGDRIIYSENKTEVLL